MTKASWLKAGGVFVASLSLAAGLGYAFTVLAPAPVCDFPVHLDRANLESGIRATVVGVEGEYAVATLAYKVVLLDVLEERVVEEGSLADALGGTETLTYVPRDGEGVHLQPGDAFLVEAEGDVHLLLLRDGVPVAWTAGCEA